MVFKSEIISETNQERSSKYCNFNSFEEQKKRFAINRVETIEPTKNLKKMKNLEQLNNLGKVEKDFFKYERTSPKGTGNPIVAGAKNDVPVVKNITSMFLSRPSDIRMVIPLTSPPKKVPLENGVDFFNLSLIKKQKGLEPKS